MKRIILVPDYADGFLLTRRICFLSVKSGLFPGLLCCQCVVGRCRGESYVAELDALISVLGFGVEVGAPLVKWALVLMQLDYNSDTRLNFRGLNSRDGGC